jgi:uncharacterized repeat protein (TIGR01451 family)
LVNDSGAATKTFEYTYPVPASGPSGTWNVSVAAPEGTEGTVTHTGIGTFRVVLQPNIVMVKSAQIVSDPYNGGVNPKAIPGATMLYDITVTNQGDGTADNVAVGDAIPANTALRVADIGAPGSGPVAFINGATASGLNYTFSGLGSGVDNIEFSNNSGATWTYTPVPDGNGVDTAVTNIRIPLSGTFNAAAGANQPSFMLRFQVVVK